MRQVKRFNNKKTFAGRTVKRTIVNAMAVNKARPKKKMKSMRAVRKRDY